MQNASRVERERASGLRLVRGPRIELLAAEEPADSGPEIFNGLRIVRTLAMLSIVGYHLAWEPIFGIAFGLISLQVIMCALAGRGVGPRPMLAFARRRTLRLLVPWIAWSVAYGLFEIVRNLGAGAPPFTHFEGWMWIGGTSFHLWFLPFAFVASLAVNAARVLVRRRHTDLQVAAWSTVGVLLLLAIDPLKARLQPSMPFDLWIDGVPTLAFGLAVGRALGIRAPQRRAVLLFGIALASLLPFLLARGPIAPSQLYERYAVAIPVVCLGLLIRVPDRPWMATLAATNLGVYLVHLFAIRITDHLPGVSGLGPVPRTAMVYAACLLAVICIRRTRIPHIA